MSWVNYAAREINCKIVYYGPPLAGKLTNLEYLHKTFPAQSKSKLVNHSLETDRLLTFDVLGPEFGTITELRVRFHVHTIPGAVFYRKSRLELLKEVDGVVFVADSQQERHEANFQHLYELECNLRQLGRSHSLIPYILQCNKRDLPGIMSMEDLKRDLQRNQEPVFEAIASQGIGVEATFLAIARLILIPLRKEMKNQGRDISGKAGIVQSIAYFPPTTAELVEQLASPNCNKRAHLVEQLGERRDPQALEALLKCLSDPYFIVVEAALTALGKSGDRRVLGMVSQFRFHTVPNISQAALKALLYLEPETAIPEIIKAIRSCSWADEQRPLIDLLGQTNSQPGRAFLLELVHSQEKLNGRMHALEVLGDLKCQELVPLVRRWFHRFFPGEQARAIQALGKIGGPEAVSFLQELLQAGEIYQGMHQDVEQAIHAIETARE